MSKQIIIAGESPFIDILQAQCLAKGYVVDLYHIDDLDDQDVLDRLVNAVGTCDVFIER